jgi:hypothetical protein
VLTYICTLAVSNLAQFSVRYITRLLLRKQILEDSKGKVGIFIGGIEKGGMKSGAGHFLTD